MRCILDPSLSKGVLYNPPCPVMTLWSVKLILVCNTDLFRKVSKIGLYLDFILRKSLYFQNCWKTKSLTSILKLTSYQTSNVKLIASAHGLCFLHSSITLLSAFCKLDVWNNIVRQFSSICHNSGMH